MIATLKHRKSDFKSDAMSGIQIVDVLTEAFGPDHWPPPLRRRTGDKKYLLDLLNEAMAHDDGEISKTSLILGSLVLGEAAERVFESIYSKKLSTTEISLVDQREHRNDADYRLINGQGRPLYRLNIKFHGSQFRNTKEVVGLDPTDCFPLATYKIKSALDKQDQEHLPYLFVVVTGSDISAESIRKMLPEVFVQAAHFGKQIITTGKRALEEKLVERFIATESDRFKRIVDAIETSRWYVFSARRAQELMKEKLFDRVFALKTRSFNRAYRNAEIDMHLSFSEDMKSLDEFLELMAKDGHFKLAGMLERGTI
jgi:hypothetical protein